MAKVLMRNGVLVGNPLAGADLNKLSAEEKHRTLGVLKKAEAGGQLALADLTTVMQARRATGATVKSNTDSIRDSLRKLKQVLK